MKTEENNIDFNNKTGGWAMINGVIVEGFDNVRVRLGEVYLSDEDSAISISVPIDNVNNDDFWIAERDANGYQKEEKEISKWIQEENDKMLQALSKSLAKNESRNKTEQVIKEISDKYECYVYTAFDDDNDNLSTMDNIIGYNDEYACCIEIFSDLADPNDFQEANFGITDEYINSIIEIREETLKESAKIEAKYNQYGIKTTTSKWNQGCEYGMAIYVWIPFQ